MASPTAPRRGPALARAGHGQVAGGGQGQDPTVPAAVPGGGRRRGRSGALADTLDAVARCGAGRRILALDGPPGEWIPPGFEIIAQRGASFDPRLAAAWSDAAGPGLQIGMDTPQVTAGLLDHCLETAARPGATAALGRAVRRRLVGDRPGRTLGCRRVHRRPHEHRPARARPADPPRGVRPPGAAPPGTSGRRHDRRRHRRAPPWSPGPASPRAVTAAEAMAC